VDQISPYKLLLSCLCVRLLFFYVPNRLPSSTVTEGNPVSLFPTAEESRVCPLLSQDAVAFHHGPTPRYDLYVCFFASSGALWHLSPSGKPPFFIFALPRTT